MLIVSSTICILIKLSYIGASLFALISIIKFYRTDFIQILKEKLNIFIIILLLIWFLKNLIISGCLIFPVILTCLNPDWSPNINDIDFLSKEIKGFARDTRERLRYTDFNHTIYSLDWFLPWFKDYALNTAFIKISFFVSIFSLFFLFIFNSLKLLNIDFSRKIKKLLNCLLDFCTLLLYLVSGPRNKVWMGYFYLCKLFFCSYFNVSFNI